VVICLDQGGRLFAYGTAGASAIPKPHLASFKSRRFNQVVMEK